MQNQPLLICMWLIISTNFLIYSFEWNDSLWLEAKSYRLSKTLQHNNHSMHYLRISNKMCDRKNLDKSKGCAIPAIRDSS